MQILTNGVCEYMLCIGKKLSLLAGGCFCIIFMQTNNLCYGQVKPSVAFHPKSYICYKTIHPLSIDGRLDEISWKKVQWTDDFVDIEGDEKPEPRFKTRVKMLWDEEYLYIAAHLEEPQIWGKLTRRDAVIFHDNDFEVFIDPDGDTHHYYELEINALGTVWDLMLTRPYRDGGRAIDAWDIRGLKTGIGIDGTLNNPSDVDSGWTVELALPWYVLEEAAPGGNPPAEGDQWRINFSRVQWRTYVKDGSYMKKTDSDNGEPLPENNWVWSPQGIINMHYPEMWGFIQFSGAEAGSSNAGFRWQKAEDIKWYLRRLYYRQHEWKRKNDVYTSSLHALKALELLDQTNIPGLSNPVVHSTQHTFEIIARDTNQQTTWHIRENGKVWVTKGN